MLVQRVSILLWKYLLVKKEQLFYWWKLSKFRRAALFAKARRFSGLKIGPFWDSTDYENWYSYFSRKQKAFCENNLHQTTYQPESYLHCCAKVMAAKLTNCELSLLTEKRRNIALSRRRNLARKVINPAKRNFVPAGQKFKFRRNRISFQHEIS